MSDHDQHSGGHHDHGGGGHEVDKMPSGRLFNLLFGLSGLTLVACIGVVQLFYRQVDSIRDTRDAKVSFQLAEYRQEMDEIRGGRVLEMTDDDGVPAAEGGRGVFETRRFQMPVADARKRVLEQPQLLKAGRPYRGWRNPDANAPKTAVPAGPGGRQPARPLPRPGAEGQPGTAPGTVVVQPGQPGQPGSVIVQPGQPSDPGTQPIVPPARPQPTEGARPGAEGKAPTEGKAPARGEGKAEGKAPARREAKAEGKAPAPAEGKANE